MVQQSGLILIGLIPSITFMGGLLSIGVSEENFLDLHRSLSHFIGLWRYSLESKILRV